MHVKRRLYVGNVYFKHKNMHMRDTWEEYFKDLCNGDTENRITVSKCCSEDNGMGNYF